MVHPNNENIPSRESYDPSKEFGKKEGLEAYLLLVSSEGTDLDTTRVDALATRALRHALFAHQREGSVDPRSATRSLLEEIDTMTFTGEG